MVTTLSFFLLVIGMRAMRDLNLKFDAAFWNRWRRRRKAELAWRRYVLQQRLIAFRRTYSQSDREWDSKTGRYL